MGSFHSDPPNGAFKQKSRCPKGNGNDRVDLFNLVFDVADDDVTAIEHLVKRRDQCQLEVGLHRGKLGARGAVGLDDGEEVVDAVIGVRLADGFHLELLDGARITAVEQRLDADVLFGLLQ